MLQRLLTPKSAVSSQLINREDLYLLPDQWKLIEWIANVLKPFKVISEALCGSKYPTMSMVYPSIRNLIEFVLNEQANPSPHPAVAEMKARIKTKLQCDFMDGTDETLMRVCTLVDPR